MIATARTKADLNLRIGPSTDYQVLTVIPKGVAVSIDGEPRDRWYPVVFAGHSGWSYGDYLIIDATPDTPGPPIDARAALLSFLHIPYIWGGQSRDGLDCSGLVGEWWKRIGFVGRGYDTTADKLYDGYRLGQLSGTRQSAGQFGALAFYGSGTNAGHVTICWDDLACIGANGGSKSTKTAAQARARGAAVRMDPIGYRRDLLGIWLPAYGW